MLASCDSPNTTTAAQPIAESSNIAITNESTGKMDDLVDQIDLAADHNFAYRLDEPIAEFKLPNKLKEISGLGIDPTGQYLYAVQDEEGDLFVIDTQKGEVVEEGKFHKDGDYEGVEFVNDRVFVVKSSGNLYEVVNFLKKDQELIKHKFDFHKNSDIEGLGYDPLANRLLVSCKGKAGKGDDYEFKKGIFAVDLDSMQLSKEPIYTISVEAVKHFLEVHNTLEKIDKLVKLFQPGEEFIFGPSGLAVHPKTGEIYITSSVGKLLVVLDRTGHIQHMVKLKKKIHPQPEGIVFAADGTLYISNEGKGDKGVI
ncbi:MAG: SdiA-regulated domain-containing protein, partial [Bacteroidota bacterium]